MTPPFLKRREYKLERKSGVKCSLCGYEFNEDEALAACKSCAIMKGCKLIRCPNCNFEMPPEPKWLKSFRKPKKDKQEGA